MIPDRSQPPSLEHPMGVAVCGTPIVEGLIVWSNEFKAGRVTRYSADRLVSDQGWFTVTYPTGGGPLQNAERVATHFIARDGHRESAKARYEQDWAELHPEPPNNEED